MIVKKLEVGPFGANCYLVGDESNREAIIIDPGADADRILKVVKELKLNIRAIVLTHGHFDHVNALSLVKQMTGAPVVIHPDDASLIRKPQINPMFGMSQSPVELDRLVKGGDSIDFGDMHFTVVHTPGHSRGSICLLGDGVVFSGDTLFNYGIGRYDLPGGNLEQLMNSLRNELMVLPDDTVVYPGHGPDTTIGTERSGNPFLNGAF